MSKTSDALAALTAVQALSATYLINRDNSIVHLPTCRRIGKLTMPAPWYDGKPLTYFLGTALPPGRPKGCWYCIHSQHLRSIR